MMFPALFIAVFLGGLEPQAAAGRTGFSLNDPAPAAQAHVFDEQAAAFPWIRLPRNDSVVWLFGGRYHSDPPAPWMLLEKDWPCCDLRLDHSSPSSEETPSSSLMANSRARFAGLISEGSLAGFDDQGETVTFRSAQKADSAHQPGPLEDEVIAASVRSRIATDAELRKLKLTVTSQSGKVRIGGVMESASQAIAFVKLALGVDGVEEVKVDLPPDLRATLK